MRNWWVVSGACLWEWCFSVVMFAHIARVEVAARMGELNPGRPTVLACARSTPSRPSGRRAIPGRRVRRFAEVKGTNAEPTLRPRAPTGLVAGFGGAL